MRSDALIQQSHISTSNLTQKQENFCLAYVETGNASEAYRRTYNAERMRPETVNKRASELLSNGEITGRVRELRLEIRDRLGIDQERVLREIARLAFFDPRKLFDAVGKPISIQDLDDDMAAALAGLDVHEEYEGHGNDRVFVGYTKKYRLADKGANLDRLARHLGLFETDNEQTSGILAHLPRELLKELVERLKRLNSAV